MSDAALNKDLERTRELAGRIVDGTATPGEATELSTLLRARPELRDAYLAYVDTHALLSWEFRSEAEQATQAAARAPQPLASRKFGAATIVPWSLAGLAMIVAAVALLRPIEPNNENASSSVVGGGAEQTAAGDGSKSQLSSKTELIAALVVDEAGAEFAPERSPRGVRVGPGNYELLKGVVHFRFAEGADLVLAGPAKLAVTDSLHVRLTYGKVRVIAPPTAKGFTIATPAADYVDLGTEFGLRVEPENGASDLYVFDGQVNVAEANSGRILSEVFEGNSSRCVRGVTDIAPELKETDFPNPGAIGFVRWQEYERRMNADPDLLGFYPFRRGDDEAALTNTQRDRVMADGRIAGPRWTLGRWPGKEALLFERDSDFVGLDIPGEHRELSIAAWIKVDRLDFELNAILNSDGSAPGDVHFQMTRQGLVRGGLLGPKPYDNFIGNPVQFGRWAHVAIVISALDHTQKIYVDGKLSRDRPFVGEAVIKPGVCRLGNWLPDTGLIEPNRALRGRIDELAIWKRALTEGELARLIEASRPELLWNETSPAVATHR